MELTDLTAADLPSIDERLTPEVLSVLSVAGSIASRNARGGTAQVQVEQQLREVYDAINAITDWVLAPVSSADPDAQKPEPDYFWTAERPE
jgi:argininosuccinate lyase